MHFIRLSLLSLVFGTAASALEVPAFTAYIAPDPHAANVSKEKGIKGWAQAGQTVQWFGELKATGKLKASVQMKAPLDTSVKLQLTIGTQKHEATANGEGPVLFGEYDITKPGYTKFELASLSGKDDAGAVQTLVLDGPATTDAHFNLDPRRNAASVHLKFETEKDAEIAMFYNEVTGVEEPSATYYMACGFARGYFGMQVNSPTERRIIFSVWDAGSGVSAKDRSTVDPENQTQLLGKGKDVVASVFGNEGTGGHSHLIYPWKTGEAQRFVVTAKPDGTHTIYSGYWFHPEQKQWTLLASFRAPKDGGWLRGLYSFSEDFDGSTGHVLRKAFYGPQWIKLSNGKWQELTTAKFSHDPTGKECRLDRFMGVENGKFFLSHGGFVPGFTKYGEPFTRPATGKEPEITLPQ